VPHGSQWDHVNFVDTHLVMANVEPLDEVARRYAVEAAQVVARRPSIVGDLLQAFAYFHHLQGNEERVAEITENTVAFGMSALWQWLVLTPLGATSETMIDHLTAYEVRHPYLGRVQRNFTEGPRLFAEEFDRWP